MTLGLSMSEIFEKIRNSDRICPDCIGTEFYLIPRLDGSEQADAVAELVCVKCGSILREENGLTRDIAYEIETHQPESPFDFETGKVGSYLRDRDLYRAVPSLTDGFHLGERATRKRELKKFVAPIAPSLRALLNLGSQTLTKLGLRSNHVIGNTLAHVLSHTYLDLNGEIRDRRVIVDLAIRLLLSKRMGSRRACPYLSKLAPLGKRGLVVYEQNGGLTIE